MPRFHFHLVHGNRKTIDSTGKVFDDLAAAKKAAELAVRDKLVEQLLQDNPEPDHRRFEITDEKGRQVAEVKFRDFLPPEMKG